MSLAALGPWRHSLRWGPRRKMRRVTRAPGDHPTSAATQERSSLVVPVTRFKGGLAAVLEGWPWFATIAAVAVINLGSAPLLEGWPAGIFWLGGLNLVLVLAGLFAVHRRHRAPPQEYELRVDPERVELRDALGEVLWGAPRRRLTVTRESFVTTTRSGIYRRRVLGLRPTPTGALGDATEPLFLLDPRGLTQRSAGKRSVTPHYVLASPDVFAELARTLGE